MNIKNKRISIKRKYPVEIIPGGCKRHRRSYDRSVYENNAEELLNAIHKAENLDTLNPLGDYIFYHDYGEGPILIEIFNKKTHELSYLRDINKLITPYTMISIMNTGYISDNNMEKFSKRLKILRMSSKESPSIDQVKDVLNIYKINREINPKSGCEKRAHELGKLLVQKFKCNLRTIWAISKSGRLSPNFFCPSPDRYYSFGTDSRSSSPISVDSPPTSPETHSTAQEILWNHHVAIQFVDSEKIYDPLFPDEFLDQAEWLERINTNTTPIQISYRYAEYLSGDIV